MFGLSYGQIIKKNLLVAHCEVLPGKVFDIGTPPLTRFFGTQKNRVIGGVS